MLPIMGRPGGPEKEGMRRVERWSSVRRRKRRMRVRRAKLRKRMGEVEREEVRKVRVRSIIVLVGTSESSGARVYCWS